MDAIDNSMKAIRAFKNNQKKINCENFLDINIQQMDIMIDKPDKVYDIIICNPPYISNADYLTLDPDVINYDPQDALTDYKDGLSFYIRLAEIGKKIKRNSGSIIMEFGVEKQITMIKNIFSNYNFIEVQKDCNNMPRIIEFV